MQHDKQTASKQNTREDSYQLKAVHIFNKIKSFSSLKTNAEKGKIFIYFLFSKLRAADKTQNGSHQPQNLEQHVTNRE